jgi:hypothetical protein
MPITSKPITRAEYYAQRYDLAKSKSNSKSKKTEIKPGQPLYLEVTPEGVSDTVLTAPDTKATTDLKVDTKEFFAPRKTREIKPGQPVYVEIKRSGVDDKILSEPNRNAQTGYTLQRDLRGDVSPTVREKPLSKRKIIVERTRGAYRETVSSIDRFYQEKLLNPLNSLSYNKNSLFYKPENKGKVLFEGKLLGEKGTSFYKGVRESTIYQPTETLLTYGAGRGAFKIIKSSPGIMKVASSGKGKVLGAIGLGAYGVGTARAISESPDPYFSLGRESVKFAAFSLGSAQGLGKPSRKQLNYFAPKKEVRVNTIEYFKTISKAKSFEGNVLDLYRKRPNLMSGVQKSQGGGLFNINGKFRRLTFTERGFIRDVQGAKYSRSTATINIQPYGYTMSGRRLPSGRLRKASMVSEQLVFPSKDESISLVRGISEIRAKSSPKITRLVSAKYLDKGERGVVSGFNVDVFRNKKVLGSLKQIKGFNENLISIPRKDFTFDVSRSQLFGRSVEGGAIFKKDVLSNVKRFNRKEFIGGANSLAQVSQTKLKSPSLISENVLKDVVKQDYVKSVSESRYNIFRYAPKPLVSQQRQSIARVEGRSLGSKIQPKLSSRLIQNVAPVSVLKQGSSLRSGLVLKSNVRQKPLTKQSPLLNTALKQDVFQRQALRQAPLLRQQTMTKQTYFSRARLIPSPFIPSIATPLFFDNDKRYFYPQQKRQSFKAVDIKTPFKYVPSIQAQVFNIRGKISKGRAKSGLFIRPLIL